LHSSWKTAADALLHGHVIPPSLKLFLSDPKVLELLAHPFQAFPPPSQQTKNAFETRTSAINVTPSANARHDIKEVKEDALWLSSQANIDEVVALRIVLVECQDRPMAQLLGRLSNEELRSIQEAAGVSQPSMALLPDSDSAQEDFHSQRNRQLRILKTYLSERRNLLLSLNIVVGTLYDTSTGSESDKGKEIQAPESWMKAIATDLYLTWEGEQWVSGALSAIAVDACKLESGCGWFKEEGGHKDIETAWVYNQLMELSYSLQILFQVIDLLDTILSSTATLAWLEFAKAFSYFDHCASVSHS
jgi:nuclear pore complex protein Nup188